VNTREFFDHLTQRLPYLDAGHNPPLFLGAGETNDFKQLSSGGLIVSHLTTGGMSKRFIRRNPKTCFSPSPTGHRSAQRARRRIERSKSRGGPRDKCGALREPNSRRDGATGQGILHGYSAIRRSDLNCDKGEVVLIDSMRFVACVQRKPIRRQITARDWARVKRWDARTSPN
jgi:hypothetical protein